MSHYLVWTLSVSANGWKQVCERITFPQVSQQLLLRATLTLLRQTILQVGTYRKQKSTEIKLYTTDFSSLAGQQSESNEQTNKLKNNK